MAEYEYDDGADYGGRVLWARIIVFAIIALSVFVLGRCTKGSGVDQAELAQVTADRDTLRDANDRLESTVEELNARIRELTSQQSTGAGTGTPGTGTPGTPASPGGTPGPTTPSDAASGPAPVGGETYVVQPGDTLSGIANQVYGDPTKFGLIAQANGITDSNPLQVGQSLTIPPNPDQ